MVALGMALVWGGYSAGLWGWCLIRDYNLTFGQLVSPTAPYGTKTGQKWPPPTIPGTQIWPGKQAASATAAAPSSTAAATPSTATGSGVQVA